MGRISDQLYASDGFLPREGDHGCYGTCSAPCSASIILPLLPRLKMVQAASGALLKPMWYLGNL